MINIVFFIPSAMEHPYERPEAKLKFHKSFQKNTTERRTSKI